MPTQDVASYLVVFIKSAKDHISKIKSNFSNLSKDSVDGKMVDDLYIDIHALKGSSTVMGYSNIANLCDEIDALVHPSEVFLDNKEKSLQKIEPLINRLVDEISNLENSTNKKG